MDRAWSSYMSATFFISTFNYFWLYFTLHNTVAGSNKGGKKSKLFKDYIN